MSADVVITSPSRTYRVPMALTASVGKEQATLDDVFDAMEKIPAARGWAEKIISGVQRDESNRSSSCLEQIDYDPDKYLYVGFTASADDDFVYAIGRMPQDNLRLDQAEYYKDKQWQKSTASAVTVGHGVALDRDLLAFTASAFRDGCQGVYLMYGSPVMFLDEQPLLAAGTPEVISNDGHIYAVVDGTDTTAVMDLIMIKPGPQVFRRDGGAWVADQVTLDALQSVQPPPIVELSGDTLTQVMESVDMAGAQQLAPDAEGGAEAGELLGLSDMELKQRAKEGADKNKTESGKNAKTPQKAEDLSTENSYKSNQDKSQLKDGSTAQATTAALVMHHENAVFAGVVASGAHQSQQVKRDAVATRKEALSAILSASDYLRDRKHELENIILPALMPITAAGTENTSLQNKKGTAELRKYWLKGRGAAKIRWNTPGDFTRCDRQLRKYLGSRSKGYCANLHRAATGVWPGDKKNVGKKD